MQETILPLNITFELSRRELQVIGGPANVPAAEFEEWFEGLWHGESLAWTVAVLTAGTSLAFRFVALRSGSDASPSEEKTPPPGSS